MDITSERLKLFDGLRLVKGQWKMLSLAVLAAFIILTLDFFLTVSMPRVIDGLQTVVNSGFNQDIPKSLIILSLLIIIRPLVGWMINYLQINIILNILRNIENDIFQKFQDIFLEDESAYSNENAANMLISHGRYFVDNFLIPFIRATTDLGTIIVIALGLLLQFPIPLTFFLFTAVASLTIYQLFSRKLLIRNGEICLRCYEEIIKSSKDGFDETHECVERKDFLLSEGKVTISEVLNQKKKATIVLGSISQGLKFVVEFCFMLSFGVAAISIMIFSSSEFAAFVATFAYAGVRMLPSFTSIIAFFQSRSAAEQAVKELLNHLMPVETTDYEKKELDQTNSKR